MGHSKPLMRYDKSAFDFIQELSEGQPAAAVNFDFISWSPKLGRYVFWELCKCEESQKVNPWTSHPNRYWYKNWRKFQRQWHIATQANALYLIVNYAERDTEHEKKVRLLTVTNVTRNVMEATSWKTTREEFKKWFQEKNQEILDDTWLESLAPERTMV